MGRGQAEEGERQRRICASEEMQTPRFIGQCQLWAQGMPRTGASLPHQQTPLWLEDSREIQSPGPRDLKGTGKGHIYSPALAAASTKVPLPWLWKRKLGPFSLSQKISEALLLRMGPTLTPRPARRRGAFTVSAWCPGQPHLEDWAAQAPDKLKTGLHLSSQSP